MHRYLGILSSDALNRDGYVIAFEALEQGISQNAIEGLPSLIDHDFHRPLGWIFPYGLLIEPKISKTVGNFFVCETDDDSKLIYPKIQDFWQRTHYERTKDHKAKFIELLNEFKTLLSKIATRCFRTGIKLAG